VHFPQMIFERTADFTPLMKLESEPIAIESVAVY